MYIYVPKHVKEVETVLGLAINNFLNKFDPVLWLLTMLFYIGFDQGFQPVLEKMYYV